MVQKIRHAQVENLLQVSQSRVLLFYLDMKLKMLELDLEVKQSVLMGLIPSEGQKDVINVLLTITARI